MLSELLDDKNHNETVIFSSEDIDRKKRTPIDGSGRIILGYSTYKLSIQHLT